MKIASIMWNAYVPMLQRAAGEAGVELNIFPNRLLDESPESCREAIDALEKV